MATNPNSKLSNGRADVCHGWDKIVVPSTRRRTIPVKGHVKVATNAYVRIPIETDDTEVFLGRNPASREALFTGANRLCGTDEKAQAST